MRNRDYVLTHDDLVKLIRYDTAERAYVVWKDAVRKFHGEYARDTNIFLNKKKKPLKRSDK